jgi:organic hydroperoxide reductase OsmC/OhrA
MALVSKVFTYEAELRWEGGRRATVSAEERPALEITPPSDFPGGDPARWSPEHLFLASLQSCTMLSFVAHCAHNGLEIGTYESRARGRIERRADDQRYAFRDVQLVVMVRMAGGHAAAARALTDKAERDCFISASTSAEIVTDWRIIG